MAPLDVAWMADVRAAVQVPVLADESVSSVQDAMALVRAGAADVLSVYVGKGGGINPARKVAAVAEAAGLTCTVGSNLELGIGNAGHDPPGHGHPGIGAEEFPLRHPQPLLLPGRHPGPAPAHRGGRARPWERPGLGVELDPDKVQRYRVQS